MNEYVCVYVCTRVYVCVYIIFMWLVHYALCFSIDLI